MKRTRSKKSRDTVPLSWAKGTGLAKCVTNFVIANEIWPWRLTWAQVLMQLARMHKKTCLDFCYDCTFRWHSQGSWGRIVQPNFSLPVVPLNVTWQGGCGRKWQPKISLPVVPLKSHMAGGLSQKMTAQVFSSCCPFKISHGRGVVAENDRPSFLFLLSL
jgi:hypothetical protein